METHFNSSQATFYNAINLINDGDYGKILKIKNKFQSWENAWERLGKGSGLDPDKEWKKLADIGVKLLLKDGPQYPKLLKEIPHPPFGIYVLGNLPEDSSLFLAIVGTRKATYDGKNLAKKFAFELAKRDFVIVSGLAFGIDAAAHAGCLESSGRAVAVLANGLDRIRPRTNEWLGNKIIENGGALISEYPLGTESFPSHFLERNRIISGLGRGTLIVEAPLRSGSLATARFTLEQNREVFVIPGPITHPNFYGSNQLIRAGAELVTCPEEILEAFGLEATKESANLLSLETEEEKKIFEAIREVDQPAGVDKLVELTNLNISDINKALTFLTIKNIVKETKEGYIII